MNQLELAFRKRLCAQMAGRWLVAIHVENHLNPGVPDLSYVMLDPHRPEFETGWLELKAVAASSEPRPKLESSQHEWMRKYAHRVPTHFLILVGTRCYLLDGKHHSRLAAAVTLVELEGMAIIAFEEEKIARTLTATLKGLTRRDNGNGFERAL